MYRSLPAAWSGFGRSLTWSLVALLALGLTSSTRADPPGSSPPDLKKVRVLLAIDTNSDLAASVRHDQQRVETFLRGHIPPGRYDLKILQGSQVTREAILNYYQSLKTGPDEALLFFYAGHGVTDSRLGPCFEPQQTKVPLIPRADVRRAMEQKHAGLVILLSDCCSVRLQRKGYEGTPALPATPRRQEPTTFHPMVRCLLFQHRGVVDITAAVEGTGSFGDDFSGGVFTHALCNMLGTETKNVDRNHDGFVTWREFFPALSSETERSFKSWAAVMRNTAGAKIDQSTQKPWALALPDDTLPATPPPVQPSYAVVSLLNETRAVVQYRYRWLGQTDWQDAELARDGKAFHQLALADPEKPPLFEIEGRAGKEIGKATLKPRVWKGAGSPGYGDGEEYKILVK
jgi:hypothetical protein